MLHGINIKNFKSIRKLEFLAKRVNIFIGEPNTGKSNILEALAFFSQGTFEQAEEVLRFNEPSDLFYDQDISQNLEIKVDNWKISLNFDVSAFNGALFWCDKAGTSEIPKATFLFDHERFLGWTGEHRDSSVKYYRFKQISNFNNGKLGILNPPFGDNLVSVISTNEKLSQLIKDLLRTKGLRLQIRRSEKGIEVAKDVNDNLFSYPWSSVSETLRRIVFYMAILETNKNSTLLLDEPESNTFPFYTKYLAERIAHDESNQFFLTTHNPYLLSSLIEKTPAKDLAVFVTTMDNYETKLTQVSEKNLSELLSLDADFFFNLNRLVNE